MIKKDPTPALKLIAHAEDDFFASAKRALKTARLLDLEVELIVKLNAKQKSVRVHPCDTAVEVEGRLMNAERKTPVKEQFNGRDLVQKHIGMLAATLQHDGLVGAVAWVEDMSALFHRGVTLTPEQAKTIDAKFAPHGYLVQNLAIRPEDANDSRILGVNAVETFLYSLLTVSHADGRVPYFNYMPTLQQFNKIERIKPKSIVNCHPHPRNRQPS